MKRSQMVRKMVEQHLGMFPEQWVGENQGITQDIIDEVTENMSKILTMQEHYGILPPAYDIFQGRENTFNDKMMSNQWEPEDV